VGGRKTLVLEGMRREVYWGEGRHILLQKGDKFCFRMAERVAKEGTCRGQWGGKNRPVGELR